jgi:cytochrome b6-f complex iron-sulfur subunit
MERKEFLSLLGTGTALVFGLGCLGSCGSKDSDPAPNPNPNPTPNPNPGTGGGSTKKDFTLNLDDAANSSLKTKGNALRSNGVIVAYTNAGTYIAVASTCTHEGGTVGYEAGANNFVCPNHGSAFSATGSVVNGPATQALKQYNTTLTGATLRVYES